MLEKSNESNLINLFQFWDSLNPPLEIKSLLNSWTSEIGCLQQLYDYEMARELIKSSFDATIVNAFDKCGIPAMQADFFRYCILYVKSGIYVDADIKSLGRLLEFIAYPNSCGLLIDRRGKIANDFMYFTNTNDPLLLQVIIKMVDNIANEVSQNVWEVTGPGIMTKFINDSENEELFNNFVLLPVSKTKGFIQYCWQLDYKNSDNDWRRAQSNDLSIFRK